MGLYVLDKQLKTVLLAVSVLCMLVSVLSVTV